MLWLAATSSVATAAPPVAEPPAQASHATTSTALVSRALALLGVNYRFGGNTPEAGLDCSGLVRHVFHDAIGLVLPRRSEEISRTGESVQMERLQPGDLVFFNTVRRAFSHVGIYIGNNQFVHAPSSGGHVRVESLTSDYWADRFNGARRLIEANAAGRVDRASRVRQLIADDASIGSGAARVLGARSEGGLAAAASALSGERRDSLGPLLSTLDASPSASVRGLGTRQAAEPSRPAAAPNLDVANRTITVASVSPSATQANVSAPAATRYSFATPFDPPGFRP